MNITVKSWGCHQMLIGWAQRWHNEDLDCEAS
jgi:hypothetical protein